MVGQAQTQMMTVIGRFDTQRVLKSFADWTDRIAAGELRSTSQRGRRGHRAQCRGLVMGLEHADRLHA